MNYGVHIYLWVERWSDSTLGVLDAARRLGLDYVELACGDDVVFDAALTRRAAQDNGLELAMSPGGEWPMAADISLPDPADQRRGVEWHRRVLDLCAELGAVAYAGAIYGHPGHVERHRPTEDEYERVAEHLRDLAEYGAERGVRLVLEPMSHFRTHLVNRPEQALQLLDLADHPNLGILLDTYHMVTEVRDYAAAVRTVGERLWGLHACESDRGVPGGGLVPWEAVFEALAEIGFDGHMALETYNSGPRGFAHHRGLFNDPCPDADAFIREGLAFLRGFAGNRL